jgi:hypothetical protein
MVAWDHRYRTKAAAAAFVGISIQFSAAFYSPISMGTLVLRRLWRWLPILLVILAACLALPEPSSHLLRALVKANIPFISAKVTLYEQFGLSPLSVGAAAYAMLNMFFVGAFWWKCRRVPPSHSELLLLSPVLLLIACETIFSDWPLLWNRMQYLAVPCQAVLLARIFAQNMRMRLAGFSAILLLSIASLIYFLTNPMASPYMPYRTVIEWSSDEGRASMLKYYEDYNLARNYKTLKDKNGADSQHCAILAPAAVLNYVRTQLE